MISIARIFGAPVSVPAGKVARSTSRLRHAVLQQALDVADDVHHVRVALDREGLGHLDAAGLGDAADVVARQVDQHQVLGALLRVGAQLGLERLVLLGRRAARARAGERPDRHLVALGRVLLAHQDLGRGADDLEVAHVVEVHVRRRVQRAQRAVQAAAATRCSACCSRWPICTCIMSPAAMYSLAREHRGEVVVLGELALDRRAPAPRLTGGAVTLYLQLVGQLGEPALGRGSTPRARPGRRRRSGTAGPTGCR